MKDTLQAFTVAQLFRLMRYMQIKPGDAGRAAAAAGQGVKDYLVDKITAAASDAEIQAGITNANLHAPRAATQSADPAPVTAQAIDTPEPAQEPPQAPKVGNGSIDAAIRKLIEATATKADVDEAAVRRIASEEAERVMAEEGDKLAARIVAPTLLSVEVRAPGKAPKVTGAKPRHVVFPQVLAAIAAGEHVMLVGPAGCGKSTVGEDVAEAMGLSYTFNGALESGFELVGFCDVTGKYRGTQFRKAFEHGGLHCWDELDASFPGAPLRANAAIANGHCDFPDSDAPVTRHEQFRLLACANTWGNGADRTYVGRNQLDGATLDRFVFIEMGYDAALEASLTPNTEWREYVQAVRKSVGELGIRHIVSTRAIVKGANLLAAGLKRKDVEAMALWKSLDRATVTKVKAHMGAGS